MKNRTFLSYSLLTLAVAVTLAIVMGISFAVGMALAPRVDTVVHAAPVAGVVEAAPLQLEESDLVAAFEKNLTDLYRNALPSVVRIEVTQRVDVGSSGQFGFGGPPAAPGGPQEFLQRGEGLGFVWDKQGHIVTNYHVIAGATEVEVQFAGGPSLEAEVLGTDPDADLAVIKVDLPPEELRPLPLGISSSLQPGQLAFAIGNPFGQEFTMTSGIVSAVGRTIRSSNSTFSIPEVIQTDAPINPGNSGGPLLNRAGEVIGINTQIVSRSGGSAGIGFSVPIDIAKQVVPVLIEGDAFEYSWLGISGRGLIPELAEAMNLPADTRGVVLINVVENSPADRAGLRDRGRTYQVEGQEFPLGGDIILTINGALLRDMDDLVAYLVDGTRPGDEVSLDVIRTDGRTESVTVTLGVRPQPEAIN